MLKMIILILFENWKIFEYLVYGKMIKRPEGVRPQHVIMFSVNQICRVICQEI